MSKTITMCSRVLILIGFLFVAGAAGATRAEAGREPAHQQQRRSKNEERDIGNTIAEATGGVVAGLLVAGVIISLLRRRRRAA